MTTYIIYSYNDNGCDSEQNELGREEAENLDEVIKIVKEEWINHKWIKTNNQTLHENDFYPYYDIGTTTYYDLDGNEIDQPDEYDEALHNYVEEGIRIEELDNEDTEPEELEQ
jgi:hypothetical protein